MPDLQTTDGWRPRGHALDMLSGMPSQSRVETALFRCLPIRSGNRASLSEMQAANARRTRRDALDVLSDMQAGTGRRGSTPNLARAQTQMKMIAPGDTRSACDHGVSDWTTDHNPPLLSPARVAPQPTTCRNGIPYRQACDLETKFSLAAGAGTLLG